MPWTQAGPLQKARRFPHTGSREDPFQRPVFCESGWETALVAKRLQEARIKELKGVHTIAAGPSLGTPLPL